MFPCGGAEHEKNHPDGFPVQGVEIQGLGEKEGGDDGGLQLRKGLAGVGNGHPFPQGRRGHEFPLEEPVQEILPVHSLGEGGEFHGPGQEIFHAAWIIKTATIMAPI